MRVDMGGGGGERWHSRCVPREGHLISYTNGFIRQRHCDALFGSGPSAPVQHRKHRFVVSSAGCCCYCLSLFVINSAAWCKHTHTQLLYGLIGCLPFAPLPDDGHPPPPTVRTPLPCPAHLHQHRHRHRRRRQLRLLWPLLWPFLFPFSSPHHHLGKRRSCAAACPPACPRPAALGLRG